MAPCRVESQSTGWHLESLLSAIPCASWPVANDDLFGVFPGHADRMGRGCPMGSGGGMEVALAAHRRESAQSRDKGSPLGSKATEANGEESRGRA
jgi:hypothetical protein